MPNAFTFKQASSGSAGKDHRRILWLLLLALCIILLAAAWLGGVAAQTRTNVSLKGPASHSAPSAPSASKGGKRASRITSVQIDSAESPTFAGHAFGSAGKYEKLTGHFTAELDPTDPLNAFIVNIDLAPRNSRGMVEYSADFRVLKPLSMKSGNGAMLYDIANRGTQRVFNLHEDLKGAYGAYPASLENLGDAFLLDQGYTLVWSGWQGDAPPGNDRITIRLPVAKMPDGSPYRKWISTELLFGRATRTAELVYSASAGHMADAKLYRRANPHAPLELVPRDSWSFAKCAGTAAPAPSDKDLCMPSNFSTDYIYNLVYEAQDPPVMGIGFAAMRDFISFLRYDTSSMNPLVGRAAGGAAVAANPPVRTVLMFGQSQSGRFIRDWVYEMGNRDNSGRRVVDGAIALAAGARRTYTNFIFSEPGRFQREAEDHYFPGDQFPFSYETISDPLSGKIGGLLANCRLIDTCPKIMQWDTGTEAWLGRASLITTDPLGLTDIPLPANVRYYYFSSTEHMGGNGDVPTSAGGASCEQPGNPNSYRETQRALLGAMLAWASKDVPPPASQYPKLSDGTLVAAMPQSAVGFPSIPGVHYTGVFNDLFINDETALPPRHTELEYKVYVPKTDADGNDLAGVRSAILQVPIGTYTGWNVRKPGYIAGHACGTTGTFVPFAKTREARGADPRLSLEERYRSEAAYLAQFKAATDKLVKQGFLLPKDAERLIAQAQRRDLGLPK